MNNESDLYGQLKKALSAFIPPERLIDDPLRLLAYGTDASFYRLIPKLIVQLVSEDDVVRLLALAHLQKTPVTFRAAGTSLSGQAVTDSVLAMLEGNAWRDYEVSADGERIRLQPGIIGAHANAYLAPLGKKIGPDPASIATAKIGGIAANNASGMCCGVAQNSYQTLHSMRVILADGTVLDTADEQSRTDFKTRRADLVTGLEALVVRTASNTELSNRIRDKFRIKNTTGYSLNALVDYSDPIDVLQHLMIGSEGTLGFISEITYRTVPEHPYKASALVFFPDVATACEAVSILKQEPVDAVEIMDRAALRSVEDKPGIPKALQGLPSEAAALLIETRAEASADLGVNIRQIERALAAVQTLGPIDFTDIPAEFEKLWKIRKGMFPSVGAVRAAGTAVVIEDIAFPVPKLAAGTVELQGLFRKHGYDNAIIFGHALEGNLHFVITPDFGEQTEIERYYDFMDELCHMVVETYNGSLKAEHSTGRNIAPYVELEWGADAYRLMHAIKVLFDPQNLLNPGVILNDDPKIHIKDFKPMPVADPHVDRCIECGFCEPVCPSRNLSLTPRQRIVLLRELARLQRDGDDPEGLRRLQKEFDWYGEETCAADGLCATRCPVDIDTGTMMKRLRAAKRGATGKRIAAFVDEHMGGVTGATRVGLSVAHGASRVVGSVTLESLTAGIRKMSGNRVPDWHRWLPRPTRDIAKYAELINTDTTGKKRVVYFSACVNRTMGSASADPDARDLPQVLMSLLAKAGFDVVMPPKVDGLCCGMPFASKGFEESAETAVRRLEDTLWQVSEEGRLPVLCDTSPCVARMLDQFARPLRVQEPVGFVLEHLLPQLKQIRKLEHIALHITCSARKMGLTNDFVALAQSCADEVFMPEEEGCCGFAGDKGFSYPELNASALSRLRSQLPSNCEVGYSNSRTCEIGLARHAGIPYRSIAYLVDECFTAATEEVEEKTA